MIGIERHKRKKEKLSDENTTPKEKWKKLQTETGQKKFENPDIIIDEGKQITNPKKIAEALNRQYLSKVRKTVNSIHPTETNPLDKYKEVVGDQMTDFHFKQISMSELLKEVSNMKPTTSAGQDMIPMRAVKAATRELAPLLLNMVNQTIAKKTYPKCMKTTKIKPIRKKEKDKTNSDGWRPVNIVQSLAKIIERVYLRQILNHLETNDLINHSHHGGIRNKSTLTIITEIHDNLF